MKKIIFLFTLFIFNTNLIAQQTVGLFQNDQDAFNGYTLFAPTSSIHTYLIDNCGNLINQWTATGNPGLSAYLLENGNLLRTTRRTSTTFVGGGIGGRLEIYDWNNNLIWQYDHINSSYHQHHDIDPLPNGNILILSWENKSASEAIAQGRNPSNLGLSFWPTRITEIEPIGFDSANVVWEWHIWDHLIQDFDNTKANFGVISDHPELLDINFGSSASDWLHCNSIDYNAALDQILISSRNLSEVIVIDHSTTTIEAASHAGGNSGKGGDILYRWGNPENYDRGNSGDKKLFGPHDASWVPVGSPDVGKITIFNNGLNRPTGMYSSVEMIQTPVDSNGNYSIIPNQAFDPSSFYWSYDGNGDTLFSLTMCGANQLPNGNVLICNRTGGELREVNMNKDTKWLYITPLAGNFPVTQGGSIGPNGSFRAYRYAPNYSAFNGLTLTPGNPIELNPLPSNCIIYTGINNNEIDKLITVYGTFYGDQIFIKNNSSHGELNINFFNLNGQKIYSGIHFGVSSEINTEQLSSGMFVIQISDKNHNLLTSKKIIR